MTTPPINPTPGAPEPHSGSGPADQPNPGAQQENWNPGVPAAGGYVPPAGSYTPPAGGYAPPQGQAPQPGYGPPQGQAPQPGYAPPPGQIPPQPGFGQAMPPGQWPAAGGGYPPPPPGVGPGYGTGYPAGLGRGLRRGGTALVVRLAIAAVVIVVVAVGGLTSLFHFGHHHHAPGDVHDAETSSVGQCAKIAGSDSAPVVITMDCADSNANYKVAVKLSTSYATCPSNDYLSVYRPGFEHNFKVCYQLNAQTGECFKQDTDDNYIQTPCTADAKFRIGRIVAGQAVSSACGADAESSNTLVYPQPTPQTICLVPPTDSGN